MAVVAVLAVIVVVVVNSGDSTSKDRTDSSPSGSAPTSAAPADSITYEITGTIKAPLTVIYSGAKDPVETTVDTLPWSTTVSPNPGAASIYALPTDFLTDAQPDITLKIKRGDEVLKTCSRLDACVAIT
ncbi:hypothetical protein BHQ15_15510 [Mycolicibacillus koreensis]|uniref:Uncharacterized protein n=1 Tax=Mycolicibacillus koreensis TaxID=1069220 RepID=A0AA91PDK1_9MYCO|nr:hypothetical protein BHQ15_15510 [Mycolicibacillus koreensis]OSC32943.1 hypothetical protein B8W67_13375 [Mycolicibacillus koreensis]